MRRLVPVVYTLTAFLGASLIFLVEPLVAKLLLPSYGGTASVWTLASFFFQVVLLMGYLLTHGVFALPRWRWLPQTTIATLALLTLPLALPESVNPIHHSPTLWLLRTLIITVFLPFLLLSTLGPLLQRWYSLMPVWQHEDPYFLYAASNAGSFLGLLAYPFAVEPHLSLSTQRLTWSAMFVVVLMLVIACAAMRIAFGEALETKRAKTVSAVTWRQRATWTLLALLPSSLMLGVTTYISTDVAAIPLLWVVPLSIYLATMVWAFSRRRGFGPYLPYAASLAAVAGVAFTFAPYLFATIPTAVALFLILALCALAAHGRLAALRPAPESLTQYFVFVSLGGALGGAFNGLIAPIVFTRAFEFPLMLSLVPLLTLPFARRRAVVALTCLVLLVSIGGRNIEGAPGAIERSRTFYGIYEVKTNGAAHAFIHGTTIHGTQYLDGRSKDPTEYYARRGPLGDLFRLRNYHNVTVVGLGAGTIAAYGKPGMNMSFIDVDPAVIAIAKNPRYFTYLRDSQANITTRAEDGRLALAGVRNRSQDLIVLDAFSSDSIPVHLLTTQAVALYESKLAPGGILAIHISNRSFDLTPVVANDALAAHATALGLIRTPDEVGAEGTASYWTALVKDSAEVKMLHEKYDWFFLPPNDKRPWTDDYSSVLSVLNLGQQG